MEKHFEEVCQLDIWTHFRLLDMKCESLCSATCAGRAYFSTNRKAVSGICKFHLLSTTWPPWSSSSTAKVQLLSVSPAWVGWPSAQLCESCVALFLLQVCSIRQIVWSVVCYVSFVSMSFVFNGFQQMQKQGSLFQAHFAGKLGCVELTDGMKCHIWFGHPINDGSMQMCFSTLISEN